MKVQHRSLLILGFLFLLHAAQHFLTVFFFPPSAFKVDGADIGGLFLFAGSMSLVVGMAAFGSSFSKVNVIFAWILLALRSIIGMVFGLGLYGSRVFGDIVSGGFGPFLQYEYFLLVWPWILFSVTLVLALFKVLFKFASIISKPIETIKS